MHTAHMWFSARWSRGESLHNSEPALHFEPGPANDVAGPEMLNASENWEAGLKSPEAPGGGLMHN